VQQFHRSLLDRVRELSGVRSAALTSNHPLDAGFTNSFVIVGREAEAKDQGELKTRLVSDGYFETAGVRLEAGRFFDDRDRIDSPTVLVLNAAAVTRYFPDQSSSEVLGQKLRFWGAEREIVGVVGSERMHGLGEPAPPAMYVPMAQTPAGAVTLMVKTSVPAEELIAPVRTVILDLDPELAAYDIATMEETIALSLSKERFTSSLLALFSALAVLLAGVGVHGVLSYLVARRRVDIGLRMALGARRVDVASQVAREAFWMSAAGVLAGSLLAYFGARFLSSELFGVDGRDPRIYAAVAASLLIVAVAASFSPARRAASVDPLRALRSE
jgi:putative ABC transport system permease protein